MNFWLTLAVLVFLLLLLPYVRFVFIRTKSYLKIRRACRENGFTLTPAHALPFLSHNRSSVADFTVRANDNSRVYCVKMFGALRRLQTLYFVDDNRYLWERKIPLAGRNMLALVHTHTSRLHKHPTVDYVGDFDVTSVGRVIPVLLLCPAPMAVRRSKQILERHSTMERPTMFTPRKEFEYTVAGTQQRKGAVMDIFDALGSTDAIYDGEWVTGEYVFGTSAFCAELNCSCLTGDGRNSRGGTF